MNAPPARGHRTRPAVAVVLGVLLAALMVYPWPEGTAEPIVLGVVPAPFLFWMIWTGLFILYVAWMAYRWDPYAAVVRRANAEHQRTTSAGSGPSRAAETGNEEEDR
ncbi:hypothetical protein GCM10023169_36520 [Georgenia halophila]|uniref:DUF3311 domain-containing protein n=1 Tax=Georgenia halophila TaxID=620889 RepID=A0ABP8LL34_9MICO